MPELGSCKPAIVRNSVVLPAPDGPVITVQRPAPATRCDTARIVWSSMVQTTSRRSTLHGIDVAADIRQLARVPDVAGRPERVVSEHGDDCA